MKQLNLTVAEAQEVVWALSRVLPNTSVERQLALRTVLGKFAALDITPTPKRAEHKCVSCKKKSRYRWCFDCHHAQDKKKRKS
jgi:hypothetical protein